MRSIWIILAIGLPAALGLQVDEYCGRGFRQVLSANNCDYYAYGPQTLMTSYCHWDEQPYYGITSKFCCSGACAYCFKKFSKDVNVETNEVKDSTPGTLSNDDYETTVETVEARRFEKLLVAKMEHMIKQETPK